MKSTGRCFGFAAALLLILCGGHAYAAGGPPPSINDLVGTWTLKCSGTEYELDSGATAKYSQTVTWEITLAGGDMVNIHCDQWGVDISSLYRNGALLSGSMDLPVPGPFSMTQYVQVTGSAPKLKMTGAFCIYDLSPSEVWAEVATIKGSKNQ
jgi:hypothetical protein